MGRLIKLWRYWMSQKPGKGDALRKEKALLHTFVAGQKYGVGRDAPRRFCLSEKAQGQQINHLLPSLSSSLAELYQHPEGAAMWLPLLLFLY